MSMAMTEVLGKLDRGEIDSQEAVDHIEHLRSLGRMASKGSIWIEVQDLGSERKQFQCRIPLQFVRSGLMLAERYVPELTNLDFDQLIWDLRALAEGSLMEVEDFESNKKLILSIIEE